MALLMSRATSASGAWLTSTVRSLVAPSPSAAMSRASSLQTSVSAAQKLSWSGPLSSTGAFAASPLARAKTQSLGAMSPSTTTAWKLASTALRSALASEGGAMAASVQMTAIIVAICGAII